MSLIRACGIVLYQGNSGDERFLLLRNRKHGTWGFPKGHLEKGEMPIDGAEREAREETGLHKFKLNQSFRQTISYPVTVGQETKEKQVTFFLAETREKSVKISEEHDRFVWTSADDAEKTLQHDDLRGVLRAALQHLRENSIKQ